MNTISCLIPAGGSATDHRDELERRLSENHAELLDGARAEITWRFVEPGLMFTAGSPSTSAVIACTMRGPTTLADRESYMRRICDFWTQTTGCTDHEVMVSIAETSGAPSHEAGGTA